MRRGAIVTIANRHDDRAARLAEEVGCRSINWSMRASNPADVIINATPVGMHPNVDDTPLPAAVFNRAGNGRLRHDLSPGEHHVDQAGAGTRLPDGHRRRHVSPSGRRAVQALYGPGGSHRRDGRGPQTQAFTAAPRMTRDPAPPRPRRPGRGLALVGYRGTGKSTVGRIVADRSGRTFLDADLELEARAGRSVSAILTEEGEPVFRDWEERTLAELIEQSPTAVIATGGGVVLREQNRRRLRDFGFIVWLTAEPAELASRLQADPRGLAARPALTADGTIAEIARVLEIRAPIYQAMADAVIDTGGKSPDQVAAAILACWMVSGP